jgi:lysophospholipase L1-like esterase
MTDVFIEVEKVEDVEIVLSAITGTPLPGGAQGTDAPYVVSGTVSDSNKKEWVFVFNELITYTSSAGWNLLINGTPVGLSAISGDGTNTIIFTSVQTVKYGDILTYSYDTTLGNFEGVTSGINLPTIPPPDFTNSVTQAYSVNALAVINRMPYLIEEIKPYLATYIDDLDSNGLYDLISEIYFLNLGKQSGVVGFKQSSGTNNGVVFDERGGLFDGVSNSIDSGWQSNVNGGGVFTQNDAAIGVVVKTINQALKMGLGGETTTPRDQIYFNAITSFSHQVNGSSGQTVAHILTAPFMTSVGRVNNNVTVYGDGVALQAPVSDTSKPINSTSTMKIGTRTSGGLYFDGQLQMAYMAGEVGFNHSTFKTLTDTFVAGIESAWNTFNTAIFFDDLSVAPTDPSYSLANFTYASLALNASGTFAFGAAYIKNQISSYLDNQFTRYTITINDNTSVILFGKEDSQKGSLAKLDMGTKELYLARYDSGVEPNWAVLTPVTFGWSITNGDIIEIEVRRDMENIIAIVRNLTTNKSVFITGERLGLCRESPILYLLSGNISVTGIEYNSNIRQSVKCAIYGDSITEGDQLYTYGSTFYDRYAYKIKDALFGNCLISGLAGQNSTFLPTQMEADLDNHTPTYVIVLIGANDSDFTTWKNNLLNNIIPKIIATGAIPVLCTLTPRASVQAFINSANSYLLGQSTYRVIDMAFAVTTSGDRVNWVLGYDLDGVHPSATGHSAMFAQAQLDLPELFI